MGINVTVNSNPVNRIAINSQKRDTIRTVSVAPVSSLAGLSDVDATSLDNNETVVYDSSSGKFIIKELPVINGGSF
jgi:hypothetical protein